MSQSAGLEGWEIPLLVGAIAVGGLLYISSLTVGNCTEIAAQVTDGAVALGEVVAILGAIVVAGVFTAHWLSRRTRGSRRASFHMNTFGVGGLLVLGGIAMRMWAMKGAAACVNGIGLI